MPNPKAPQTPIKPVHNNPVFLQHAAECEQDNVYGMRVHKHE